MKQFFKNIIAFFAGLTDSLKKKWNTFKPTVKQAFTIASSIVDEIQLITNSSQAKAFINLLIPRIGPIAFAALEKFLPTIVTVLGIGKTITLENTVEQNILLISQYLKEKKGIDFASNADQLYKLLTLSLADGELTFSEIQLIGKWVYDNVIVPEKK